MIRSIDPPDLDDPICRDCHEQHCRCCPDCGGLLCEHGQCSCCDAPHLDARGLAQCCVDARREEGIAPAPGPVAARGFDTTQRERALQAVNLLKATVSNIEADLREPELPIRIDIAQALHTATYHVLLRLHTLAEQERGKP